MKDDYEDYQEDEKDDEQGEDVVDVFQMVNHLSKKSSDYELDFDYDSINNDDDNVEDESSLSIMLGGNKKHLTTKLITKEMLLPEGSRHNYRFIYNNDESRVFEGYVLKAYAQNKYIFMVSVNGEQPSLRAFTLPKIKLT